MNEKLKTHCKYFETKKSKDEGMQAKKTYLSSSDSFIHFSAHTSRTALFFESVQDLDLRLGIQAQLQLCLFVTEKIRITISQRAPD